jgi:glycosyltransferase 2 family protein
VAAVLISSLLIWAFAVLPVDLILQGFGIHLPITASMFIMVLLVFAVMVPASPGFIGTYHYACFKGLSVFGIPESTSISIALIIHGTSFFPVIVAGFYHLWSGKISLNNIRKAGDVR